MNCLVLGSSFASAATVNCLLKFKKIKITVVSGGTKNNLDKKKINLVSRFFSKYSNVIGSSLKLDNVVIKKKDNFLSFNAPGGLSNIWGKIMNAYPELNKNKKISVAIKEIKKLCSYKDEINQIANDTLKILNFNKNNFKPLAYLKDLNKKNKINLILKKNVTGIRKEKSLFSVDIDNKSIKKKYNAIFIATGIFSALRILINFITYKYLKKKIYISHYDMIYGIIFIKDSETIKKIMKTEKIYLSKSFAGRLILLNKKNLRKFNLKFYQELFIKLMMLLNYKILALNLFYKRELKKTYVTVDNNKIIVNAVNSFLNKKIILSFKVSLSNLLKLKSFSSIFIKTRCGSDFHYSSNLTKFIIQNNNTRYLLKNLHFVGMSSIKKTYFFPTFQMMADTYLKVFTTLKKI